MTHKELYNVLNNTVSLESEESIELNGKWKFDNQLFFLNTKENNGVINMETISKIFDYLNQSNKLIQWGVQNHNVE